MTNCIEIMTTRLQSLSPSHLEIRDDSADHIGHGAKGGHYTVIIRSPSFEGQSAVKCHQLVYQAIGDLLPEHIHALIIDAKP